MNPTPSVTPIGGLATTKPPVALDPSQSPDMLNAIIADGAVSRRGGFQPEFRDMMLRNCVSNTAYEAIGRETYSALATDSTVYLTSAGCLNAGHRKVYEQQTGFTFALWFSPGDLQSEHGGNANDGSVAMTWHGSPYTIMVQPILSKGPIKRSDDIVSAPATDWGTHAGAGMPFCLYLYNNAGTWELRLSAHVLVAGSWTLQTVASTVAISEGGLYHIIGVCSGTRVALRVARYYEDALTSAVTYTQNSTAFSGTLAYNKCPIQVFDCPQRFVQDTNAGSPAQRPGLNLGGATDGGYWFACVRPNGKVQDISIWAGDLTLSDLERRGEVVFDSQEGLINLWSMSSYGLDYIREETGRGNHLYFVPRGPIEMEEGGRDGGSWFFNGQTSYAAIDCVTPNWRAFDSDTKLGAMHDLVVNNRPYGLFVDVWPESVEPGAEQVIAEIHGAMKLVIDTSGRFAAYIRDGDPATVTALPAYSLTQIGAEYQGPLTGTTVVECGERYHVAVSCELNSLDPTKSVVRIYIDGVLEAESAAFNSSTYTVTPYSGTSNSPGGVTIGIGSRLRMIRGDNGIDTGMPDANALNTDHTLGFFGRVETFGIVGSSVATTEEVRESNKPESDEDWRYKETGAYRDGILATPGLLSTSDYNADVGAPNDPIQPVGLGSLMRLASQQEDGRQVVIPGHPTGSPGIYAMVSAPLQTDPSTPGKWGHDVIEAVGGHVYHTLCYYRFKSAEARVGTSGSYVAWEWIYDDVGASGARIKNHQRHPTKLVHLHPSYVTDQIGSIGMVTRCCTESDQISEDNAAIFHITADYRREITHRFRPYNIRSPYDLGAQWSAGLVASPPGDNPVTALAEYEVEGEGIRITIAGSGRQLYYAKRPWDGDGRLMWYGERGSYCYLRTSNVGSSMVGAASKTTVVFSAWVRPSRLDGNRIIARKWAIGDDPSESNWLIFTGDGAINVMGTEGGSFVWRFVEGQASGATPGSMSISSSLRVGVWSHLQVEMGGASPSVTVRVDGRVVPLYDNNALAGALQTDPMGSGSSDGTDGDVYLGGFPGGRHRTVFPATAGSGLDLTLGSWCGNITEAKIWTTIDTTRWPTGKDGYVPEMGTMDSSALYEWMLDEGAGALLLNTGTTAASTENGEVRIREFYEIASGIEQAEGRTFRSVAYRDTLILTNGVHDPLQVKWNGLSAAEPITVRRLGTEAPVVPAAYIAGATTTLGATVVNGIYIVEMTYVTEDGTESEPSVLATYELTTGPFGSLNLRIANVPKSPDPQVIGANIYVSATGGGEAVFQRFWPGHSPEIEASVIPGATGVTTSPGTRLPAPKGRHLGIAGSALVIADLPEEESGQNAFAFSTPSDVSYFTLSSTAIIDSQDGAAIVGIGHNMGQVFLSKKDSVHALAVGSIVNALSAQAQVRMVYSSDGIGGGLANTGNLLYGAGDRGVFVFNNSEPACLSDAWERTWRTQVDSRDVGLYRMHGSYLNSFRQYWLSVDATAGTGAKTSVYVLDLETGAWSPFEVPEHSIMTVLEDPYTQARAIAIGTTDGRVLIYGPDDDIDGASDMPVASGAATLTNQGILTGTSTSLNDSGALLPTALAGLAGAEIEIVTNAGTFVRKIARNWTNEIQWEEPIPGWTTHLSYTIGGFEAYWTSPWLSGNVRTKDQKLVSVQAEFTPRTGNLDLDVAACAADFVPSRDWPTTSGSSESLPAIEMSPGYTERPRTPRSQSVGAYHRVKFSTSGIRKPWDLMSYGLEIVPGRSHAKGGRTS